MKILDFKNNSFDFAQYAQKNGIDVNTARGYWERTGKSFEKLLAVKDELSEDLKDFLECLFGNKISLLHISAANCCDNTFILSGYSCNPRISLVTVKPREYPSLTVSEYHEELKSTSNILFCYGIEYLNDINFKKVSEEKYKAVITLKDENNKEYMMYVITILVDKKDVEN